MGTLLLQGSWAKLLFSAPEQSWSSEKEHVTERSLTTEVAAPLAAVVILEMKLWLSPKQPLPQKLTLPWIKKDLFFCFPTLRACQTKWDEIKNTFKEIILADEDPKKVLKSGTLN